MSKIAERVLKLQALATQDTPEGVSAAAMARKLMMAHALTQADVDAAQKEEDPLVEWEVRIVDLAMIPIDEKPPKYPGKTMDWKRKLAFAIASYLGLQAAYTDTTSRFTFYGHRSDCQMAVSLWGICARQIDRESKVYQADKRRAYLAHGMYWDQGLSRQKALNFCASAVEGLKAKFHDLQREQARDQAEGNALMVSRAAQVEEWVEANYSFKKGRALGEAYAHNADGYNTGRTLKLHADVGIEGTTTRRLGST